MSILCLCFSATVGSRAQTAGTVTFGANVTTSGITNAQTRQTIHEQSIGGNIGFSATDHFAFGIRVDGPLEKVQAIPFTAGVWTRLYAFSPTSVIRPYLETGAGLATHHMLVNKREIVNPVSYSTLKGSVYVSPGINIRMGQVVALELGGEYRYIAGTNAASRLSANAGVRFFLSEERFKRIFPHTFARLN